MLITSAMRNAAKSYAHDICQSMQLWGLKREQARAIAKEIIANTRDKNYAWKRADNTKETLDTMQRLATTPEEIEAVAKLRIKENGE